MSMHHNDKSGGIWSWYHFWGKLVSKRARIIETAGNTQRFQRITPHSTERHTRFIKAFSRRLDTRVRSTRWRMRFIKFIETTSPAPHDVLLTKLQNNQREISHHIRHIIPPRLGTRGSSSLSNYPCVNQSLYAGRRRNNTRVNLTPRRLTTSLCLTLWRSCRFWVPSSTRAEFKPCSGHIRQRNTGRMQGVIDIFRRKLMAW